MCDEVFGEEGFVGEVIRKTKYMTGDDGPALIYNTTMIYFTK